MVVSLVLVVKKTSIFLSQPKEVVQVQQPEVVIEKQPETNNNVTKTQVYKWVDEEGNLHFSDKTLEEAPTEKVTVTRETTEFKKSPKIRTVYVPSNRQTGTSATRSGDCKRWKKQVAKDEEYLRTTGRQHSSVSQRLSDTRWKVIKNC